MNIVVYDKNSMLINKNERIIKSKDIICPKCGELCLINFNDYKILLNNCKNKHVNIISFNEFEDTQNINENKIICYICNNNKGKTYNNTFFLCGVCNKNICPLCKVNHNKDHILIDYDNKNYLCHKHNEQFVSYCDICKENLCMRCDMEHDNNHKIISYKEIKPKNLNNIKDKIKEIKDIIDKFNNNIDEIIILLQNIKNNIEKIYVINNNILNNFDVKNRSYQIFNNINNIDNLNNNIIMNDLKNIINESNVKNKFSKIFNLYEKISKNNVIKSNNEVKNKEEKEYNKDMGISEYRYEINLIYKTENKGKQNIFGKKFVENNKNNIELIINGTPNELIDEFDLEEGNNNIKLIIKNDLINLEYMFYECKTLYNIDDLKYLNTNFCTNFSYLFWDCLLLSDIKSLENWNVSNSTTFEGMFGNCLLLSDIKPLEK